MDQSIYDVSKWSHFIGGFFNPTWIPSEAHVSNGSPQGRPCGDCLKHFFCELCALTQQYRELKNRGFNMDLGWAGNVQRQQNQGAAMGAPVFQGGMNR
ncbi:unnamed protein product [Brassica napus]|uniref:(rape) hypothetical protein n=1 Tax=Brassica napus TaxID=3708 RepID=A0A816P4B8_BRANA|nr:unnamed protein product [Brassica napus]